MWNRLTSEASLRATCVLTILGCSVWSISWLGVTGLGEAKRLCVLPEPLFVVLFAPTSLIFMASGFVFLALNGFLLTLAASLACLGISTCRVLTGATSRRMVILAALAVLAHSGFLLAFIPRSSP